MILFSTWEIDTRKLLQWHSEQHEWEGEGKSGKVMCLLTLWCCWRPGLLTHLPHRGMRGWVDECEIERWRLRDLEVYQPIFIWLRWTISGWAFAGGTSFPLVWEILFGRNWALEGGCERVELSFSHCRTEESTELPFLQRLTTNSPYEQLCNDTLIDLEVNIIARR